MNFSQLEEDKHELARKIRLNLMFPTSGGTGTHIAISQSVGMLNDDLRNRPSALILITDGPTQDRQATRDVSITFSVSLFHHVIHFSTVSSPCFLHYGYVYQLYCLTLRSAVFVVAWYFLLDSSSCFFCLVTHE